MLVHVALFGTKIVITHITICGIVLQPFAAAEQVTDISNAIINYQYTFVQ